MPDKDQSVTNLVLFCCVISLNITTIILNHKVKKMRDDIITLKVQTQSLTDQLNFKDADRARNNLKGIITTKQQEKR